MSNAQRRLTGLVMCFLAVPALVGLSSAQDKRPVPQALLDVDYQNCSKSCSATHGPKICEALCTCTITEFKNRMDFDAYLDLRAQLAQNKVSPDSRAFLDKVANYCAAEADRNGVEIDLPEGEGATEP